MPEKTKMPDLESNKEPSSGAGPYKGLHTSINSTFTDPDSIRVDCCALSCCGILQSDYNRFVLHRKLPSTWKNRFVQHILIPIVFFFSAGYAAVFIPNQEANQIVCTTLLFISICWVIAGCMQSTHKRALARRDLLRTVRHGRGLYTDSVDQSDIETDQSARELLCAHRLCGCYPSDDTFLQEDGVYAVQNDMCARMSRLFSALCCGKLFKCHWQILGICALAQEGRELDRMVPAHERMFDYLTFQPYVEYFNSIRALRKGKNGNLWSHYKALSKLSRVLLKTFLCAIISAVFIALTFEPSWYQWEFHWQNLLVFLGTFLQAFIILYFVHWYYNRFDISLDAVIKYFACGFAITTISAIVFELIVSMFAKVLLGGFMVLLPVEAGNDDGYGFAFSIFEFSPHNLHAAASGDEYKKAFLREYPVIAVIFLFFNAYFIAALVEEMCKYFGFKMVEHPDFLSETNLQKAAAYGVPENKRRMHSDRDEWGGGLDCIGDLDCVQSDSNLSDDSDDINQSQRSSKKDLLASSNSEAHGMPSFVAVELTDAPPRDIQSIGAAITIAMVAVSLGFACCENLIYIFIYNGKKLSMEISVLLTRSLFPVHPLCAGKICFLYLNLYFVVNINKKLISLASHSCCLLPQQFKVLGSAGSS